MALGLLILVWVFIPLSQVFQWQGTVCHRVMHIQERKYNMLFYEQSLTINYLSKTTLTRVIVNELFPFYICQNTQLSAWTPIHNIPSSSSVPKIMQTESPEIWRMFRNLYIYCFHLKKHPNHKKQLLRQTGQTDSYDLTGVEENF